MRGMNPYTGELGPLKAEPLNAAKMMKTAIWMLENYKFEPRPFPGYIVLHPNELRKIEERWGNVDSWWKEYVCSGEMWKELLDG